MKTQKWKKMKREEEEESMNTFGDAKQSCGQEKWEENRRMLNMEEKL